MTAIIMSKRRTPSIFFTAGIVLLYQTNAFLLLPLLGGASLYKAYLEQGIRFRENIFLGNEPILKEYDFVVVGAGAGGSVVANRLSENARWKVLVLEAGEDETIYTDIPATVSHWANSDYDWGYTAERTGNACLAMEQQRCRWTRGKVLGGSTTLNNMIYTRGHRKDYDDYEAAGNYGWGYDQVLPYFLKSENNSIEEYRDSPTHGHRGYLPVQRVAHRSILLDAFLEGGAELGYKRDIDYTDATQMGFSRIQATQQRGRRVSAAKAFLKSAKARPNLHVAINSRVTRVLVDAASRRAIGVEFVKNGQRRAVMARKEVILSAGALNTPQLLMLSGIGPKEHLREMGIPLVKDLPVGENLHEHYSFLGLSFMVNATGSALVQRRVNMANFVEWLDGGKGVLTLPGAVEGLAYVKTKNNAATAATKTPDDYPDVEYIFASGSFASDGGEDMRRSFGISRPMYDQIFGPASFKDTWTILPMLLHPRTTGRIRLRDKNPWHAPKFYFDYFADAHDMQTLVRAIKGVIELSETNAFRRVGTRLTPTRLPQCAHRPYKSDEYWACMAMYFTGTLHHQSGTCKMGPAGDKMAVVDPELRVYGVRSLRVVDASVFPKIPGAHLYAPTLMVGEKAADMIKETWKVQNRKQMDHHSEQYLIDPRSIDVAAYALAPALTPASDATATATVSASSETPRSSDV